MESIMQIWFGLIDCVYTEYIPQLQMEMIGEENKLWNTQKWNHFLWILNFSPSILLTLAQQIVFLGVWS